MDRAVPMESVKQQSDDPSPAPPIFNFDAEMPA
jgi:hypothetical protein